MKRFSYILFVISSFAFAKKIPIEAKAKCPIYANPAKEAMVECEVTAGEPGFIYGKMGAFFKFQSDGCEGFIPKRCVQKRGKHAKKRKKKPKRKVAQVVSEDEPPKPKRVSGVYAVHNPARKFRLGLTGHFSGQVSSVSGSGSGGGRGLGINLGVYIPVAPRWRANAGLTYQSLRLMREVASSPSSGGSTEVSSGDVFKVRQSNQYIGATLAGSYLAVTRKTGNRYTNVWFEGGLELLNPVDGSQLLTDGADVFIQSTNLKPNEKLLLLTLGGRWEFPFTQQFIGDVSAQIYANMAGTSGDRLYGARVGLTAQLAP